MVVGWSERRVVFPKKEMSPLRTRHLSSSCCFFFWWRGFSVDGRPLDFSPDDKDNMTHSAAHGNALSLYADASAKVSKIDNEIDQYNDMFKDDAEGKKRKSEYMTMVNNFYDGAFSSSLHGGN